MHFSEIIKLRFGKKITPYIALYSTAFYNNCCLIIFIIKFRYNARADWLKQRALSEYRCTEQRCHAISPFANFLDFSLGFIYFIIIIFRSRRLL